jgi:hypothetical protein
MKYNIGDTLADYGFSFFEKLHTPIFLIHKNGTLKKVNEAGRKLISVSRLDSSTIENFMQNLLNPQRSPCDCQRLKTHRKQIRVMTKSLSPSDYLLVELIR